RPTPRPPFASDASATGGSTTTSGSTCRPACTRAHASGDVDDRHFAGDALRPVSRLAEGARVLRHDSARASGAANDVPAVLAGAAGRSLATRTAVRPKAGAGGQGFSCHAGPVTQPARAVVGR